MTDFQENSTGEQDDISFLRTGDVVCLTCLAPCKESGTGSAERVSLAAEGFGNRICYLENVSDKNKPPDNATSMFYIDQALSVRALQEMMSSESPNISGSSSTHRTLLYGHAVQLKHALSGMYLTCLSTSSASDKLAFDVGLCETNVGEFCWWTIHPASKQRSEGEKVRFGDDVILVSVATERYLHMSSTNGNTVLAAFHQTLWSITPNSSGGVRERHMGYVCGNDVLRLNHGNDECLTIPENWSDSHQNNIVIYENGKSCNQARSLWRPELIHGKWQSSLIGWEQAFRIRHITSGRFLALNEDNQVCLLHKDRASFESTAFIMISSKDVKRSTFEEKEEEGMGVATVKYGETVIFLQHLQSNLWLSCQTTAVTKKNMGKVEEKKAIAVEEARMDDCFILFKAQEEESQSARVIRKCSQILNRFLRGLEGLQMEGKDSLAWNRADLSETVKLMEDLIQYFAQPEESVDFESMQNGLRALRNRQDLFQEEGLLNMIIDTIDQFSAVESMTELLDVTKEDKCKNWQDISTYLYLLVAAMIKGNHSNCTQFASAQRLNWLFSRLSNPQSAEGILDVLYCILTESPEALNMINEDHVKAVISLLEKVGHDPKVLNVLSALCEGNGVAVRNSQNVICSELLCNKKFLLQTKMIDQVSSVMANIFVGSYENSAMYPRWYFEAELEYMESMRTSGQKPHLRIGWASSAGYRAYPGSGKKWGCNGVGDDMFSFGFDGQYIYAGIAALKLSKLIGGIEKFVGTHEIRKGDVIGCSIDLAIPEIQFSLNGHQIGTSVRNFSSCDCLFYPVMSLSAIVSCRFFFGGSQGKLRFGPKKGYLPISEAAITPVKLISCISFGDTRKGYFAGPSTVISDYIVFQPKPIDTKDVSLPKHLEDVHEKLAENIHEVWAMDKIEKGWIYGERRSETQKTHPCLTSYERLPTAERSYNLNLAKETLKTIVALGYRIDIGKASNRVKTFRLGQNFLMSNGYKPAPLDTREYELNETLETLVDLLAKNMHNIWAQSKIQRGWTYSKNENVNIKTTSHLVAYDFLDPNIKAANRDKAGQIIRSLLVYNYCIEPPTAEQDEGAVKQSQVMNLQKRTYRFEKRYAVKSGKWYFEFEVRTSGFMNVGWMDVSASPDGDFGLHKSSYAYDGYLGRKWHGESESYGKKWNVGDVVGCFLDLTDRTICFSLNGELLLDSSGTEVAFDNVSAEDGFVPAFSLAPGQIGRLNCGQNVNTLKYYTTCGLQEGYEPFCIRMSRQAPMWIAKCEAEFDEINEEEKRFKVTRIPQSGDNPPCLKLQCKSAGMLERCSLALFRLNLPVFCKEANDNRVCNQYFTETLSERNAGKRNGESDRTAESSRRGKMKGIRGSRNQDENISFHDQQNYADQYEVSNHAVMKSNYLVQKTFSLDDDSSEVTENRFRKAPRLRSSASEANLKEKESIDSQDKISASYAVSNTKRNLRPFKVLQSFGQRMRDVSVGRSRKQNARKLQEACASKSKIRSDENDKFSSGHLNSRKLDDRVADVDSTESLDMPKSGPGRRPTVIRLESDSKVKKRSNYFSSGHDLLVEASKLSAPSGNQHVSIGASVSFYSTPDDYYFGVRVFPGQDLANIWIGWLTPQFSFTGSQIAADSQRICFLESTHSTLDNIQEFRSCYIVNGMELLTAAGGSSSVSKMAGILAGCLINTATGELKFHVNGKQTEMSYRVEPGTILYPAVFVLPTSREVLQFELGNIEKTLPIASAQLNERSNAVQLMCPPRLKMEICKTRTWLRVPDQCARVTSLKLSDTRGWSVLCDDLVRTMMLYVPERDSSIDILELAEHESLCTFHQQTLRLYCSLCAQGNFKIAHILCQHVDEDQLMYAIQSKYLSGSLRQCFYDVLIAIHLKCHYDARLAESHEYIIPLNAKLKDRNYFNYETKSVYPHALNSDITLKSSINVMEVKKKISTEDEKFLMSPTFDFHTLKQYVVDALEEATLEALMNSRDLIGGTNTTHFLPILKLFDTLLLVGVLSDTDIHRFFRLLNPKSFQETLDSPQNVKGLVDLDLDEMVQLELCHIMNHLCDLQLQGRVESLINFAETFVGETQNACALDEIFEKSNLCFNYLRDQLRRYLEIKQTDMPSAEAARKTKEFRCPPKEQMLKLLDFKADRDEQTDEEGELEVSAMSEFLQRVLREFHCNMVKFIGNSDKNDDNYSANVEQKQLESENMNWVEKLAWMVVPVPPALLSEDERIKFDGEEAFRNIILSTLIKWTGNKAIDDPNLIREIFGLLLRQYTRISEVKSALKTAYCIHERSIEDVQSFLDNLCQIRRLLCVQFEATEEEVLKNSLWDMMNNKVFFQHPDLMRLLKVHENVMTIMVNVLSRAQKSELDDRRNRSTQDDMKKAFQNSISDLVVACCKFLCFICRSSTKNQAAMFEHLPFLLDNATMLLAKPSLRGSVPLDVAYYSFMENSELALALKEDDLEKVAFYLSRCGLQANAEMVFKGYPDIGWDPVEGERYVDFLRFCVWVNGECVEENANLVIRLLIRRPECLGPALKGQGEGLFRAFKDAISLSSEISNLHKGRDLRSRFNFDLSHYPNPEIEEEDYIDLGAAILGFYSSLADLLGKCAPDHLTVKSGKGESVRLRSILRSLTSVEDLEAILALRFLLPNVFAAKEESSRSSSIGLLPCHKQSILLFLERVYGLIDKEMVFRLLEQSFILDFRAATILDHPAYAESDLALALNRYLCGSVLPLLTSHAHCFADAEHYYSLLEATLHTVYRMSKIKSLTKSQRSAITEFLLAFTKEIHPGMMKKLLQKVVVDISSLNEFATVPLQIMTQHYECFSKHYGISMHEDTASEEQKRLSMLLFTTIFDSLGKRAFDSDLFASALPCLTAIGSALSPDYAMQSYAEEEIQNMNVPSGHMEVWRPHPVDASNVQLSVNLQNLVQRFAQHFHDSWASRKLEKGWRNDDIYSRTNCTHPRLKPFGMLKEFEQNFYKERCSECLKALLAWGYSIEQETQVSSVQPKSMNPTSNVRSASVFCPQPIDLSNMTLSEEMCELAERIAENSHLIWVSKTIEDLNDANTGIMVLLVPWDILADSEKRKHRFRAQEVLKFLQYQGFRLKSPLHRAREEYQQTVVDSNTHRPVEKRFACNLLEKLLAYLENAAQKMEVIKPSKQFSRYRNYTLPSEDVKFFGKVLLPLLESYFRSHRNYFTAASSASLSGVASIKEKEMVAGLFHRLMSVFRSKHNAFGCHVKSTVRCLQVLLQAIDFRSLVKINSDTLRTCAQIFLSNMVSDLMNITKEIKNNGRYAEIKGKTLPCTSSLLFLYEAMLPLLTTLFCHLSKHGHGQDFLVNDIQVGCYKIADCLYMLASPITISRKSVKEEMEKHRSSIGQCLSAFACCFPVAFLEGDFNPNSRGSTVDRQHLLSESKDTSSSLLLNIPSLDNLLSNIEQLSNTNGKYQDAPAIFDVDIPMLCSYMSFWWQHGPTNNTQEKNLSAVSSDHINRLFSACSRLICDHIGIAHADWICHLAPFITPMINYVTIEPVRDYLLPMAEKVRMQADLAFKEEEKHRMHPDVFDESTVIELHSILIRDVYALYPILIKFTDLHRARWLKNPCWETNALFEHVAFVFKLWSTSQHMKREELNFITQFESDFMTGTSRKTGKAAVAFRKKKRREGKRREKDSGSIVVACLKRLLPVGLSVFGGRELDLLQKVKEKYMKKENDEKIKEYISSSLAVPDQEDVFDKSHWQRKLYQQIGKAQMLGIDSMSQEMVLDKIIFMGVTLCNLHNVSTLLRVAVEFNRFKRIDAWRKIVSSQRKRAVVACFRMVALYSIPKHRCVNLFLSAYIEKWLKSEKVDEDLLISEVTVASEGRMQRLREDVEEVDEQCPPDPLSQLVQCFQRAATSERKQLVPIVDDNLYIQYVRVMASSIHINDDEQNNAEDDAISMEAQELEKQQLLHEQSRLADRGVAVMVLMYLSACNGEPNVMVEKTLALGIHILNGGNSDVQNIMLNYLQEKKDVRFFSSISGLMNRCSVLNLEIFERQLKAEGLGMGAELSVGKHQNLNDSEFICSLFRFIQLTCEGHNSEFQNYLRNQPGNTTSINLIICTVDYLLRLQESIMDFYWHFSSKEVVDEAGKAHFLKALSVCSQVFNTLTESIQGPCVGNQMALANSRLWDAINGFFFLFAHMMDKLSKNHTQLELLREFLSLQKDMIVLMLSMLEGNILNGSIGKQMVDTLAESQQNVQLILKFFDMFLKLKDLTTSQAFQEFDTNKDGWISPKEFLRAMEAQKMYSTEEINYLMMCTDVNNDGKIDYMEFTERFHNPAKDIGFNLAILLTNLKEHITGDSRLDQILQTASSMCEYFDPYLGRIEIMGSNKRVEKVYFEIKEEWLEQFNKPQIKQSKKDFLFNVLQDDGGEQGKLEAFVNFCEDTIFEMSHAAEISSEDRDSRIERAKKQREIFTGMADKTDTISAFDIILKIMKKMGTSIVSFCRYLRPSELRQLKHSAALHFSSMTYGQLILIFLKIVLFIFVTIFRGAFYLINTFFRFILLMMYGVWEEEKASSKLTAENAVHHTLPKDFNIVPQLYEPEKPEVYEAFGIQLTQGIGEGLSMKNPNNQPQFEKSFSMHIGNSSPFSFASAESASVQNERQLMIYSNQIPDTYTPAAVSVCNDDSNIVVKEIYEPKIAETTSSAKGSAFNFLARNFYLLKYITLALAFCINAILLFYRVADNPSNDEKVVLEADNSKLQNEEHMENGIEEELAIHDNYYYLAHMLIFLSVAHCAASLALLIAYYQLKVPLIIFKREKLVARKLEFEGMWITEMPSEDAVSGKWDSMIISSPSFPEKYWDKFVKKKVKDKYKDQFDEEELNRLLGLDKTVVDSSNSSSSSGVDWCYQIWKLGVIFTDGSFQYLLMYLFFSAVGIWNPFFYAGHLIDVVISFPMLQTILKSVTHNGKQLILTVMMVLVVVYLYTVLAFNFFRKFYVQEDDGEETDSKCNNMISCFVFNVYAGIRAGGGIGDELQSPYGDEREAWRILFDMTFHFFIIIILLAIMQGLIIDAFGDLRDQQESAQDKLESNCFICDIGKDFFERLPHGFDHHTTKEHNLAYYLFFLMHLINKDDTEYTGQETYVWELYEKRCWDFFPVGECFLKQYEEQLMAS
ncbi:Ryanodine receptor 44F [Trichinella britovi]|uniref:Ryanodine receptor 44F n=1 Tax=Trichinella britovi TaxID=45882 RepID=A0A0V1DDE2_TRIBR|nr:Ryanodine receptor 44F [Trichinella britovi]